MIEIKGLNKFYNQGKTTEFHALKDVDLKIESGEFVAIIGKSGAGKSTLLHILGGIDSYESGSYKLGDVEVGKLGSRQLAEFRNSKVGIILQDFALVEGYSVIENVMIPLRFSRRSSKEYKKLAMEALKQVGMDDLAKKDVNKLSGGQKQRVAIARAIVNEPEFILADEPTGALDTATTEQIMKVFSELNAQGKTVIIITHDNQVAECCKRIIEISDGKIVNQFYSKI